MVSTAPITPERPAASKSLTPRDCAKRTKNTLTTVKLDKWKPHPTQYIKKLVDFNRLRSNSFLFFPNISASHLFAILNVSTEHTRDCNRTPPISNTEPLQPYQSIHSWAATLRGMLAMALPVVTMLFTKGRFLAKTWPITAYTGVKAQQLPNPAKERLDILPFTGSPQDEYAQSTKIQQSCNKIMRSQVWHVRKTLDKTLVLILKIGRSYTRTFAWQQHFDWLAYSLIGCLTIVHHSLYVLYMNFMV